MTHEMIILARAQLPERPGGWRGQRATPPLWWAAVDLSVGPFRAEREPQLAKLAEAQGGAVQKIILSFRSSAAEFAEGYGSVLIEATGGSSLLNGHAWSTAGPRATAMPLAEIEHRLFREDVSAIVFHAAELLGMKFDDDETYELIHGRPRPVEPGYVVACPASPDAIAAVVPPIGATIEPFESWARRDLDRLIRVLQRGMKPEKLEKLSTVVRFPTDAFDEALSLVEVLVDRHDGVIVQED